MRRLSIVVVLCVMAFATSFGQVPYKYKRFLLNVLDGNDPQLSIDAYVRSKWGWRLKDFQYVDAFYAYDRVGAYHLVRRYYVVARKKHTDWEK